MGFGGSCFVCLLHYPDKRRQASHIIDLEHPMRPTTFSLHQLPALYCPRCAATRKRHSTFPGVVRCTDHLLAIEPLQPDEGATSFGGAVCGVSPNNIAVVIRTDRKSTRLNSSN